MSLNVIGGILIFVASCLAGVSVGNAYKQKITILTDFLKFVRFCKADITYLRLNVGETITKFCEENKGMFSNRLLGYTNVSTLKIERISDTDNRLISDFMNALSKLISSDAEEFFQFYLQKAGEMVESAEKEYRGKGSVAKKLCPLAGLTILILLL